VAGANLPPSLAAIPPQTVDEQTTLTFTAVATDPDAGQKVSYSLGVDAPAGATVDPDAGVFALDAERGAGTGRLRLLPPRARQRYAAPPAPCST
jgi:hypothetical protein